MRTAVGPGRVWPNEKAAQSSYPLPPAFCTIEAQAVGGFSMASISADSFLKVSAALALLIAASGLGYYYGFYLPSRGAAADSAPQETLKRNIDEASDTHNFNIQGKCSTQAKKVFDELGWVENGPHGDNAQYQSHYNPKLERCFVAITSHRFDKSNWSETRSLFDAFEMRQYADYFWGSQDGKADTEVRPFICRFISSVKEEDRHCSSSDEYNTYISQFIE